PGTGGRSPRASSGSSLPARKDFREHRFAVLRFTEDGFLQARFAPASANPRVALERLGPAPARRDHLDAVDRAGSKAELAADAPGLHHRVHQPLRADDRVYRARVDAQRAADTAAFVARRGRASLHG